MTDDYYVSKITLKRLDNVFQSGFFNVFKLISESPNFFNNTISADDLFTEFVSSQLNEMLEGEKEQKETTKANNNKIKNIKLDKRQKIDKTKCHALIHTKREFGQCQNNQLSDDDFCTHHSKLDVLPYGRVNFYDDEEDND
jgi:hypothetical protein